MPITSVLLVALGALCLWRGATLLVENATRLAKNIGVPLVVIGFTIVSVGTTLPELLVGILAGLDGKSSLVLGNILGSNIVNIGLVLGLAALIRPLQSAGESRRIELYGFVLSTVLLFFLVQDGFLGRIDGALLALLGIVFNVFVLHYSRVHSGGAAIAEKIITIQHRHERHIAIFALFAGVGLLFIGARLLVTNAIVLAQTMGVSEVLIGLTVVAIGTSLPEIVTAITSSIKKTNELAIGNVIGSNTLNLLFVLGVTILIAPVPVGETFRRFDMPALVGVSLITSFFLHRKKPLSRLFGGALVGGYIVYISTTILLR